jgi:predicted enzyme related to lactoylglutathione lyase
MTTGDDPEAPVHHTIDYIEIGVDDVATAKAFYAAAFGWGFTDYGPGYAGIRRPDGTGEQGGLSGEGPRPRGGPLVLLWSADLNATADQVVAAGGQVVQGPYAFPGGRRFHFLDPSGNELGVWGS